MTVLIYSGLLKHSETITGNVYCRKLEQLYEELLEKSCSVMQKRLRTNN